MAMIMVLVQVAAIPWMKVVIEAWEPLVVMTEILSPTTVDIGLPAMADK